MNASLIRYYATATATLGVLVLPGWQCRTLEPPWRDNQPNVSCIPSGHYRVVPWVSPRFGNTYLVENVPGRSHVLFHEGNVGRHTKGCVLLGQHSGWIKGELAVLTSLPTVRAFLEFMADQTFELDIRAIGGARG